MKLVNITFYNLPIEPHAIISHDGETLETFESLRDAEQSYNQWQYEYCHPEDAEIVPITELEFANSIEW